jgi:hypothetical protein
VLGLDLMYRIKNHHTFSDFRFVFLKFTAAGIGPPYAE